MKCGIVLYLPGQGETELHERKIVINNELSRRISKLYEAVQDTPFFVDEAERGASLKKVAWIPLTTQGNRLGGIYVNVGTRRLLETEMEFLTSIGIIAANALAAILWSTEPVRDRKKRRYEGIVGASREIEDVCSQIEIAAKSVVTVLIEGESGTGKELVARAIHSNSERSNGPLITVDCGSIPETLIESELFGSRRGSFTGATADRMGLIEAANRGTLFLDEIANTSPALQVRMLRVLQEREVRRVGDTKGRSIDIRLIAATNSDLESLVEKGQFRQDLLFRLNVLRIRVPPLRERREDIPDIARVVLDRLNHANKTRKRFSRSVLGELTAGEYRGNVRELQNVVERAYFLSAESNTIKDVAVEIGTRRNRDSDEIQSWFTDLKEGRKDFWTGVHARYKKRDISREQVIALIDLGLRATRGSYKSVAALFHVKDTECRRFRDFLRRNHCQPDFRPYRKLRLP